VKDALAAKGIHPSPEHLEKLEVKWREIQAMKGNLEGIAIDDADVAIKHLAGGDHHE
jgi:hypothetical protein